MWRLHRYYLRELSINAAITFLVMFTVVLVSSVNTGIKRAQGGVSMLLDAVKIMVLFALDSLPHVVTIAFLIATVLTFTRAVQDRELTAIRAAGISPRVPMTAAVLLGILLSVGGSVTLHYVIPDVHYKKYRVVADVMRNAFLQMGIGKDRLTIGDFAMTFRRLENGVYEDCTIYCPPHRRLSKDLEWSILRVDRVAIHWPEEGSDDIVIVPQGVRDPIKPVFFESIPIVIPLAELGGRDRRIDRDDDLRSDQLLAEVIRGVHPRPWSAIYTLFRRCCFSLMPLLFAPIGFCIAEFARERGRVMALVLALVPLAMFYLGEIMGARLLLATENPWCAWMPLALLLVVGLPLCWRQLRR